MKKLKKKFIALLAAFAFLFTLASCNFNANTKTSESSDASTSTGTIVETESSSSATSVPSTTSETSTESSSSEVTPKTSTTSDSSSNEASTITSSVTPTTSTTESEETTSNVTPTTTSDSSTIDVTTTIESSSSTTTTTSTTDSDDEETYEAVFNVDDNVTVTIFDTQDMTQNGYESLIAYARDCNTGEILSDGTGQINFILTFASGYELDEIIITPSDGYNKLKDSSDTLVENGYRITKISSNLSIIITSKLIEETVDNNEVTSFEITSINNSTEYTLTGVATTGSFTYTYENSMLTIETEDILELTLSGDYYGSIIINSTQDITLNLNDCNITSSVECPLYISTDGDTEISIKKDTTNEIRDNRDAVSDEGISAAIYVTGDLKLKGKGELYVYSANNNGVHSKDDLECQNLTLTINVLDNALKGNDSVTITSGNYTLIARQGDGIKTSNSDISSKGNQKGTITISGGTFHIYAACDGIDSAYDVVISDTASIEIYTDKYSVYSEEITYTSESIYYIRSTTTTYKYSIYYYNSSTGDYVWKNSSTSPKYIVSSQSMGRERTTTTYYYYEIDKPSGYDKMIVYVYTSSQSQESASTYYKTSSKLTINDNYDTIAFSGTSFSFTNYTSQTQNMGMGGMNEGNSDKGDYSTKGIKADNSITINGGTIIIESYDDAIHANNDNELENGETPLGNITISGGNITISSNDDGIHADNTLVISGGTINIETAYEGIEANQIYFEGGYTYVYSTDDAVNAATCGVTTTPCIYIYDGAYVDLDAKSGDTDTLDSNGNIKMYGGILVIKNRSSQATSNTGGTIDLDGTFTMTGGIILSFGTWCNECSITATKSSTSTISSGTYILKDSSGNELASTVLNTSYSGYRIISKLSGSYTLYKDSTVFVTF